MTRILVTGSTGFVGRQVMLALAGREVRLFPIARSGKTSLVADLPNVERVIATNDLFAETELWWAEQCKDIDVVIHAAWYTEPGQYLQSPQNINCLVGSLNIARGAALAGVKRFVGVGTCFEYDLGRGVLSVETPLKPQTPYAGAKAALFFSLVNWAPTQSMEFVWCRLFYLYGEGEDERRLVPYVRKQLQIGEPVELTTGKQIRDYLDVAEAGKKLAEVALGQQLGPVNVCSGIPITVRQLTEKIADEFGRRDLLRFGARPENLIDPLCVIGIPNL